MTALAAALALSFVVSVAIDRWPPSLTPLRGPWPATLIRAGVHLALFSAAFALSWRPWHAAFVVTAISFLFGAGDAAKRRILGEPLTFSDFALVRLAIRHPRLYYAERLAEPRAIAIFAGVAVATTAWFMVEPSILPHDGWPWLAVPPLVAFACLLALGTKTVENAARSLAADPADAARDVARFGLGGSMAIHWLAWRRQPRPSPAAQAAMLSAPTPRRASDGPRVMVAIQCESFVDIASRGTPGPELPAYRALAREAVAWGRCRTPAEGAYTMRSEFGFLTGVPSRALGLDAFDPYLTAETYADASLARRFAAAGRRSVFMHPYDRRFFGRDELFPKLGFEEFVDVADFAGAERFGPYVSDAAVADAVIARIEAAREPTFLFVVTIENHGPWGPGRLPGCDDAAQQYALHLANADRMLGRVAAAMAEIPGGGVLCAYGDHAPARTLHAGLADRGAADYVLWDSRDQARSAPLRQDIDVDALGLLFLGRS